MLSLIYGTNQIAIRNFILKTAEEIKASAIKEYDLENSSTGVVETTLQDDIFGGSTLNVLEVSKILKAQLEELFELFKRYPSAQIILVSNKNLEATNPLIKVVRAFKGKVVPAVVARPNEIFKYLDDLFSKRESACYKNFQKLLELDNDPVYILVMLQYQLKNIALAKFGLGEKLSSYQFSSANRQAQNFSKKRIVELYETLFKYDVALKAGKILPEAVTFLATQKILSG